MPNWCYNNLTITGDKKNLDRIKFHLEDIEKKDNVSPGIFMALVGRDQSIELNEYEHGGWYQANIDYWGCKWDVSYNESGLDYSDDSITMSFNSAYSPPIPFIQHLGRLFSVKCELYYEEPSCDFCGKSYFDNENGLTEEDYSYNEGRYVFDKDNFFESIDGDIEYLIEVVSKDVTFESVKEMFQFITGDEDLKTLEEIFNDIKEIYGEETES
jgi:hypothetical protein